MKKQIIQYFTFIVVVICIISTGGCKENHDTSPPVSETVDESDTVSAAVVLLKSIVMQKANDWFMELKAEGAAEEIESIDTQISDVKPVLISQSENEAVVEVHFCVTWYIGPQTIQSNMPGVVAHIDPQIIRQNYYETLELVKSDGVWEVSNYFSGPASDKLSTEFTEIQLAVNNMMDKARVTELDSAYYRIDTEVEAENVTITAKNGIYRLTYFYKPYKYPYAQAYDIAKDGTVTLHLTQ